jgi:hypothetical protein
LTRCIIAEVQNRAAATKAKERKIEPNRKERMKRDEEEAFAELLNPRHCSITLPTKRDKVR